MFVLQQEGIHTHTKKKRIEIRRIQKEESNVNNIASKTTASSRAKIVNKKKTHKQRELSELCIKRKHPAWANRDKSYRDILQ